MNIDKFNGLEIKIDYKDAIEKSCKNVVEDLKRLSPKRTGDYAKSWDFSLKQVKGEWEGIVFNRDHYRLSHLLEKGHITKDNKRVAPQVHILTAFNNEKDNFVKEINSSTFEFKEK